MSASKATSANKAQAVLTVTVMYNTPWTLAIGWGQLIQIVGYFAGTWGDALIRVKSPRLGVRKPALVCLIRGHLLCRTTLSERSLSTVTPPTMADGEEKLQDCLVQQTGSKAQCELSKNEDSSIRQSNLEYWLPKFHFCCRLHHRRVAAFFCFAACFSVAR